MRMNALEKELNRRVRKLLSVSAKPDWEGSKHITLGQITALLTYSKDGDNEILKVRLDGRLVFSTVDGGIAPTKGGIHYIDRIHMCVLELRKHMLLDDIADGVEPPIDSILERDDV